MIDVPSLAPVGTTNLLNFDGIGANGFAPPDTNGSVGSTQFVETMNLQYAVYDKTTGAVVSGRQKHQHALERLRRHLPDAAA